MIPKHGDDTWFSPRPRKAVIVSALLLGGKGAKELSNSRMHR